MNFCAALAISYTIFVTGTDSYENEVCFQRNKHVSFRLTKNHYLLFSYISFKVHDLYLLHEQDTG